MIKLSEFSRLINQCYFHTRTQDVSQLQKINGQVDGLISYSFSPESFFLLCFVRLENMLGWETS